MVFVQIICSELSGDKLTSCTVKDFCPQDMGTL